MEDMLERWYRRRTEDIAAEKVEAERRAWSALGRLARSDEFHGGVGSDILAGDAAGDRLQSPREQSQPTLTGRPGFPAAVAGMINAVTAGPNTSKHIEAQGIRVGLSRGNDAALEGALRLPGVGVISASARLQPASSKKEVVVSSVSGRSSLGDIVSFPKTARVFNTPSGELRYEFSPDFQLKLPFVTVKHRAGQYVIKDPR